MGQGHRLSLHNQIEVMKNLFGKQGSDVVWFRVTVGSPVVKESLFAARNPLSTRGGPFFGGFHFRFPPKKVFMNFPHSFLLVALALSFDGCQSRDLAI